jgi:hypothetical protein
VYIKYSKRFEKIRTYYRGDNKNMQEIVAEIVNEESESHDRLATKMVGVVERPSSHDVILGRGAGCWNHEGNRVFRELIEKAIPKYDEAVTRMKKSEIVSVVYKCIASSTGRFLKLNRETKLWHEVEKRHAMDKIAHAIRDRRAFLGKIVQDCKEAVEKGENDDNLNSRLNSYQNRFMEKASGVCQDNLQINRNNPSLNERNLRLPTVIANDNRLGDFPCFPYKPTLRSIQQQNMLPALQEYMPLSPIDGSSLPSLFQNHDLSRGCTIELQRRHQLLAHQATNHLRMASEIFQQMQATQRAIDALACSSQSRNAVRSFTLHHGLSSGLGTYHRPAAIRNDQEFGINEQGSMEDDGKSDQNRSERGKGRDALFALASLSSLVEKLENITKKADELTKNKPL